MTNNCEFCSGKKYITLSSKNYVCGRCGGSGKNKLKNGLMYISVLNSDGYSRYFVLNEFHKAIKKVEHEIERKRDLLNNKTLELVFVIDIHSE